MGKKSKNTPDLKTTEAQRLWRATLRDYNLDTAGVELLRVACMSLDNFLRFQELLLKSSPIYKNGDFIKQNPIVGLLRVERAGFLQAMKDLGLQSDEDTLKRGPGRPIGRS